MASSARNPPTKITAYIAAFLSVVLWGTSFAVAKYVMPDPLGVFVFTALQMLIGTIFLFAVVFIKREIHAWWTYFRQDLKSFAFLGIICYSGAYLVQYWGLSLTTAINQSVISNTQTFWVILLNIVFFKAHVSKKFIGGSLLTFVGIIVLFSTPGNIFSFSTVTIVGDLISIVAFILWAAYTSFSQPVSIKVPALHVMTSIFFWGNLVLLPFLFLFNGWSQIISLNSFEWSLMLYLGIGCASLVFILWAIGLANPSISSEKISLISMLLPIVSIITSVLFLHEVLTINAIIGCAIVLVGMFLANL